MPGTTTKYWSEYKKHWSSRWCIIDEHKSSESAEALLKRIVEVNSATPIEERITDYPHKYYV